MVPQWGAGGGKSPNQMEVKRTQETVKSGRRRRKDFNYNILREIRENIACIKDELDSLKKKKKKNLQKTRPLRN